MQDISKSLLRVLCVISLMSLTFTTVAGARQGAPGSPPPVQPKISDSGESWASACNYAPFGCTFPVAFKGCCVRRVQRLCGGDNPTEACVEAQYEYCARTACGSSPRP